MRAKIKVMFLFMLAAYGAATPLIIRSGLVKNRAQNQNENVYDLSHQKGRVDFEDQQGYNKQSEKKLISAGDAGHFNEDTGNQKQHLDESSFNNENFYNNGGGAINDYGNKVAHKKGHHKSGFHKTYHKDESGSNSSYYDDSDDEGDQYVYNTKKETFGDLGEKRQKGGTQDNQYYNQGNSKRGQYENSGNFIKDQADNANYNKKKYYDDRENAGRKTLSNAYNEGQRFASDRYNHHRPFISNDYYYDQPYDSPRPYDSKTITIYEDPRYEEQYDYRHYEPAYPDYHNDYRRPPRNHYYDQYDRRPYYDELY